MGLTSCHLFFYKIIAFCCKLLKTIFATFRAFHKPDLNGLFKPEKHSLGLGMLKLMTHFKID